MSNLAQNQAKFNPRRCIIKINLQRSGRGEIDIYPVYAWFSHVALYGRDDQNGGRLEKKDKKACQKIAIDFVNGAKANGGKPQF